MQRMCRELGLVYKMFCMQRSRPALHVQRICRPDGLLCSRTCVDQVACSPVEHLQTRWPALQQNICRAGLILYTFSIHVLYFLYYTIGSFSSISSLLLDYILWIPSFYLLLSYAKPYFIGSIIFIIVILFATSSHFTPYNWYLKYCVSI